MLHAGEPKNLSSDLFSTNVYKGFMMLHTPNMPLSKTAHGIIVGDMNKKTYNIGDTAYIVEHCPEPTPEQVESDGFDLIWYQSDNTVQEVCVSLVKAIAFARKAVKTSIFGVVEVYEAILSNPYRNEFPDWMVKRSALSWKEVEGGYKCEINR